MLRTSIILQNSGPVPVQHPSDGLAKNLSIAKWIFEQLGWRDPHGSNYPCLEWEIERIEWAEGEAYFPCNTTEIFALGHRLILN